MAFNNRNNLNPQSAPWGREVEQKIGEAERGLSSLRALTENNNKATNATLGALSRQQDSIIATQEGLQAAQAQLNATVGRLDLADAARVWQTHENTYFSFGIPNGSPDALQLVETVTISVPPDTVSMVSISGQLTVNIANSTSSFSLTGNTAELRVYVDSIPPQLEHVRARGLYLAGPPGSSASSGTGYQGSTNVYDRVYVPQMKTFGLPETFTFRIYCYLGRPVVTGSVSVAGRYNILVESSPGTSAGTF